MSFYEREQKNAKKMTINFFAPINNLGYGRHSYNLIREFEKLGNDICLVPPLGAVRFSDENVERWLAGRERFSPEEPSIMIFNEEYLTQFCGQPRIGFPVFELEQFTALQLACMRSCDYLMTTSAWGRAVLEKNGFDPNKIFVVNEGFDPEKFPVQSQPEGMFTFLTVGKFEERKGTMQTLRCFAERFSRDDEVRLILHCDNPFREDWDKILFTELMRFGFVPMTSHYLRGKNMVVLSKPVNDMAKLYAQADCGVFPSRAEGWNLPLMECMASGVPCIAGNWTAHTEYLSDDDYLVIPEKMAFKSTARDGVWFFGDRGEWHVMADETLKKSMVSARKHARDYRQTEMWENIVNRIRNFTWANAAQQIHESLEMITDEVI